MQVRLRDGRRICVSFNEDRMVGNLWHFAAVTRPGTVQFSLASTCPRIELVYSAATIKAKGVKNAVVEQAMT